MESRAVQITMYVCMACVAIAAVVWMGLSSAGWWHETPGCCKAEGCEE